MSFGSGKIWMNGSLVDWADAKIHIASHVIHYGTGVFEGARCYETPKGAACFRLDAHLRRLLDSGKIYRMESPLDQAGWETAVLDTIRANQLKACYIRPLMYRGYNQLGVNPLPCPVDAAVVVCEADDRLLAAGGEVAVVGAMLGGRIVVDLDHFVGQRQLGLPIFVEVADEHGNGVVPQRARDAREAGASDAGRSPLRVADQELCVAVVVDP